MNMRFIPRCNLQLSEVGLGCEHLEKQPLAAIQRVVNAALDGGINIFDVFMSEPDVRTNLGFALKGRRHRVHLQGHIGAGWKDGQYCRTRVLSECEQFFQDFMARFQTDYVDIGMLHFVDTQTDLDTVLANGMLDYAVDLKQKGIIRAVGVSSHDPIAALRIVETGKVDVLMFSLNPAFDVMPGDMDLDSLFTPETYQKMLSFTVSPDRMKLYQTCETMGVGITVMKALGAGTLLDAQKSPFGTALTVNQCIQYALTRPGVASVLVGCRTAEEVQQALLFENATDAEKDYAADLAGATKFSPTGRCMYCNHCLPCPSGIDIAQVNKYIDLAELTPDMPDTVRAHYAALDRNAADCIACGQCEARCPFDVPVVEKMRRAEKLFSGTAHHPN